jgi:hypothetical protein
LLAVFGSASVVATVTEFVWLEFVLDGTVYCAVTVTEPPAATDGHVHVKFAGFTVLQVPVADGVTVPRVKPAGQASANETFAASDGPEFETVIVYVCTVETPAVTFVSPSLFVTVRSVKR